MKTAFAGLILLAVTSALAQDCAKCSPGTSPAKYQATFSTGAVVVLTKGERDCSWSGAKGDPFKPGFIACDFHHVGALRTFPGAGLFTDPAVVFRLQNGLADPYVGRLATADIRDGAGPWTITLKDTKGNPVGTVTVVGL